MYTRGGPSTSFITHDRIGYGSRGGSQSQLEEELKLLIRPLVLPCPLLVFFKSTNTIVRGMYILIEK